MPVTQSCQIAFSCLYKGLKAAAPEIINQLQNYLPTEFKSNISALSDEVFNKAIKLAFNQDVSSQKRYHALSSLFEHIHIEDNKVNKHNKEVTNHYFYSVEPLSAKSIFPQKEKIESNKSIWQNFIEQLNKIPQSHKQNLTLWLDHFDTALQCFTSNIPSQYQQDISLYDELKTVTALATSLALSQSDSNKPLLLIQGDFFGIQDFIFSGGSETNKQAAKILRGRSFQVSLFTELAALRVLETLGLPSTSQLMNAAGKFLIIAPNTKEVQQKIMAVQKELNQWFIQYTYGLVGIGIAVKAVQPTDFSAADFNQLIKSLFQELEWTKLQRLDLTESTISVQNVNYPFGACPYNKFFPSQAEGKASLISQDQIAIGQSLVKKHRMIICNEKSDIYQDQDTQHLNIPIFGYRIIFTDTQEITGKFGGPAKAQQIKRLWDFELPKNTQQELWNGYARRYINAYIPYFDDNLAEDIEKYKNIEEGYQKYAIKTFDHLACEDRQSLDAHTGYIGQSALMTLKGDVDNLGTIFQKGLEKANFAKMNALSRQINQFFSLWLPAYCAEKNPNIYTVFAGGDDFFLIGPWYSTQKLAFDMQTYFRHYVAENSNIHFSAGLIMTKVGIPVPRMGEMAEEALEQAKNIEGKNAVTLYQMSLNWEEAIKLTELENEIKRLASEYKISTSYLYSLIHLAKQAASENIEDTIWRSHFYYRTARYVLDKIDKTKREQALAEIIHSIGYLGIERYKANFTIPLFNYFYLNRK